MPICECGCGVLTRGRFVHGHNLRLAKPNRQLAGHKGRKTYAYRQRARRFAAELAQLQNRSVTKEALLAVFKRIERQAYNSGYQCGLRRFKPAINGGPE